MLAKKNCSYWLPILGKELKYDLGLTIIGLSCNYSYFIIYTCQIYFLVMTYCYNDLDLYTNRSYENTIYESSCVPTTYRKAATTFVEFIAQR